MSKLAKVQGIDAWNADTERQMYDLLEEWGYDAYYAGFLVRQREIALREIGEILRIRG